MSAITIKYVDILFSEKPICVVLFYSSGVLAKYAAEAFLSISDDVVKQRYSDAGSLVTLMSM